MMLTEKRIRQLLELLNSKLLKEGERAELGIIGGAVMCLVFNAREATKDVDAVFEPADKVRRLARIIAEEQDISPDWLNDAAKGYIQGNFIKTPVLELSNLLVWAPDTRYMLAMKAMSARFDSSDRDDLILLIRKSGLKTADEVLNLIENYYSKKLIPPKTKYFVEEVMEKLAEEGKV